MTIFSKYNVMCWQNDLGIRSGILYAFGRVVESIINSDWLQSYCPLWRVSIYPAKSRTNDVITAGFRGFPLKSCVVYMGDKR